MSIVQIGVRRNGLHAIRGWLTNCLGVCGSDARFDLPRHGEGFILHKSWFAWNLEHTPVERLRSAIATEQFVTLESFPLDVALKSVEGMDVTLVWTIRNLLGWLTSSYQLDKDNGESPNPLFYVDFVRTWVDYCTHLSSNRIGTVVLYDAWVMSSEYRILTAERLGHSYNGEPYTSLHDRVGVEDGVQRRDRPLDAPTVLLTRGMELSNDVEFIRLLGHIFTAVANRW